MRPLYGDIDAHFAREGQIVEDLIAEPYIAQNTKLRARITQLEDGLRFLKKNRYNVTPDSLASIVDEALADKENQNG